MPRVNTQVSEWLDEHLHAWKPPPGKKRTKKDFSEHLEFTIDQYNYWAVRGNTPEPEQVEKITRILGDNSLYEICGYERPDPVLRQINLDWGKFENELKDKIREILYGSDGRRTSKEPKPRVGKSK